MKCNKCCAKIADNEEIRDDKRYYCETCWKGDKTNRNINTFAGWTIVFLSALILLLIVIHFAKEIFFSKQNEKDDK